MTKQIKACCHVSAKLKDLIDRARSLTGESTSSFVRKSITEKLERLGFISNRSQRNFV